MALIEISAITFPASTPDNKLPTHALPPKFHLKFSHNYNKKFSLHISLKQLTKI